MKRRDWREREIDNISSIVPLAPPASSGGTEWNLQPLFVVQRESDELLLRDAKSLGKRHGTSPSLSLNLIFFPGKVFHIIFSLLPLLLSLSLSLSLLLLLLSLDLDRDLALLLASPLLSFFLSLPPVSRLFLLLLLFF